MNVSAALFCFCFNAYFMLCFVVWFLHVWVEYLVFVFNLWSVWTNLCKQDSINCSWNKKYSSFYTIYCSYNEMVVCECQWWRPPSSCPNLPQRCTQQYKLKHQHWGNFTIKLSLFLTVKMEKPWADIIATSEKHFLQNINHRHFCTLEICQ